MIKSILKEIIIILGLCLAILLVLSILFYDYNQINKVVPSKIKYTTPANIAEEIQETTQLQDEIAPQNKVYTIDGSDLNLYKKSKTYNPSKENPFANSTEDATATSVNGGSSKGTTEYSGDTSNSTSTSASASASSSTSTSSGSTNTVTTSGTVTTQSAGTTKAKLK